MIQATCLITYRADETGIREANLMATLRALSSITNLSVRVIEQDRVPRLRTALPHPAADALFAYNPGPFNKSWGFNVGVATTEAALLLFMDGDLLIPKGLTAAIDLVLGGRALAAKPYRHLIDLTQAESQQVITGAQQLTLGRDRLTADRAAKGEFLVFCGGAFAIRRDTLLEAGGWDERFVGWGGEDDALSYRLERARVAAVQIDEAPALHLWHPRTVENSVQQQHYSSNVALLQAYREASDAELTRMAEVQQQLLGYREKYRPFAER